MRIKNKTDLDTRQLKKIICRAITEVVKSGEERRTKRLRVEVVYSRNHAFSGYAYYNGTYILLRLPKLQSYCLPNCVAVAKLVMHEYDHVLGYRHKETGRYLDSVEYNTEWVTAEYPISAEEPQVKPKTDIKEVRYQRVLRALKRKQTQAKRLDTSIKKLLHKKKYYEGKKAIEK